jgi:thioredoxin-related protein
MCSICKKFKKGTIDADEAREELEEQIEYLSEEHIEEIEHMLFEAEDTYIYMMERKLAREDIGESDDEYPLEEDLQEEELWDNEDE